MHPSDLELSETKFKPRYPYAWWQHTSKCTNHNYLLIVPRHVSTVRTTNIVILSIILHLMENYKCKNTQTFLLDSGYICRGRNHRKPKNVTDTIPCTLLCQKCWQFMFICYIFHAFSFFFKRMFLHFNQFTRYLHIYSKLSQFLLKTNIHLLLGWDIRW